MRECPVLLRALAFAIASLFVLPSCFTVMLWNEKLDYPGPVGTHWDGNLATDAAARELQVPIAEAVRQQLEPSYPALVPGTCALVIEPLDPAAFRDLRQRAQERDARVVLNINIDLDERVTSDLWIAPRTTIPCRVRVTSEPVSAPPFTALGIAVYRDQRDSTPVVTRILLTPVAVVLDVVLLPFSLLGLLFMQ